MSGYDNGDIKMFDLRMMCLKWETNVKSGVMQKEAHSNKYLILIFTGMFSAV